MGACHKKWAEQWSPTWRNGHKQMLRHSCIRPDGHDGACVCVCEPIPELSEFFVSAWGRASSSDSKSKEREGGDVRAG